MSEAPVDRDNFCYRHPDRQSYILCQRCGRTVCPACSTQAAVGVHCPECVKEAKANAPQRRPVTTRTVRAFRSGSSTPVVTYSLIAVCVIVFVLQVALGAALTNQLDYYPPFTEERPWTMLTSLFAHGSPTHLLFNMLSLFFIGPTLEAAFGRLWFLALYLLSGIGGGIAVLFILSDGSTTVLGASGAIFGLLGALLVAVRRIGGNTSQLLLFLGLNLVIGFVLPGIAWQAHIGGLVVGALISVIYTRTRGPRNARRRLALLAGLTALLVVAIVIGVAVL